MLLLLGFQIPRYLQKKHKEGEWMARTEAMQEVREGRWDKAGGKSEIEKDGDDGMGGSNNSSSSSSQSGRQSHRLVTEVK